MVLSSNYFIIFEIGAFIFFSLIALRKIYQKNYIGLFEIISCVVFGMILEIGNTYLAHTYSYSDSFYINLVHVPLAIGLCWSVILYCAMLLSDQYNIPWTLRPFLDAFTAVILDLAMDPVAIRLGFWHWAIPLDKEWYGMPFENIVGWILVVISFSFLVRFIRTLNYKRFLTKILMVLSPFIAYCGLIFGLFVFSLIAIIPYKINNWDTLLEFNYNPDLTILFDPQVEFWKLIILTIIMTELVHIVVWSLIKYRRKYSKHFDLMSFISLTSIHLFFIITLFMTGLYMELPILIFICTGGLVIHLLIHFLPFLIKPVDIYIFKKIKIVAETNEKQINAVINATLR